MEAQLIIFWCPYKRLFDFNVAKVSDGSPIHSRWAWFADYPTIHEALEKGKQLWKYHKEHGFKRGSTVNPRLAKVAA